MELKGMLMDELTPSAPKYEDLPRNAAKPLVGVNPFEKIEREVAHKPTKLRVIDWMRPDTAYLEGLAYQRARRAGLTSWTPTPRNNRTAHQGKRECARRVRQAQARAA